jgi:uncharacterized protein (DUF433 family)
VPFTVQVEATPLREDATGALRVGDSRVLLELVIRAFQDGATPETIVQRYSTLALPDVYAVIAYYLRHRNEVETYLARREQVAENVRQRLESNQENLSEIRAPACSPSASPKERLGHATAAGRREFQRRHRTRFAAVRKRGRFKRGRNGQSSCGWSHHGAAPATRCSPLSVP